MSIEAGVLIDIEGKAIHWHLPPDRSGGSLPDSSDLWTIIWENRKRISGFAHSHPGGGLPGPSYTDITTFAAIEAGLGFRLDWWICSSDGLVLLRWHGPNKLDYALRVRENESTTSDPPAWLNKLRELSQYNGG